MQNAIIWLCPILGVTDPQAITIVVGVTTALAIGAVAYAILALVFGLIVAILNS